jgi:hypothetical protein
MIVGTFSPAREMTRLRWWVKVVRQLLWSKSKLKESRKEAIRHERQHIIAARDASEKVSVFFGYSPRVPKQARPCVRTELNRA